MNNRFINEDLPILNSMRLGDLHLVGADRAMIRFMLAARNYPRTTLDAIETSANAANAMALAPWHGGGSTITSGRCHPARPTYVPQRASDSMMPHYRGLKNCLIGSP